MSTESAFASTKVAVRTEYEIVYMHLGIYSFGNDNMVAFKEFFSNIKAMLQSNS